MDNHQLQIFRTAFKRANNGKIDMPKHIDPEKIYDIEFYPNGMREGYKARFRIGKDKQQHYYLELVGGDDYSNWHKHIDHTGHITDLPHYKGDFGWPVYPDDPERTEQEHREMQAHNEALQQELVKKGLERNFDDDQFETRHVIKIRNYGF